MADRNHFTSASGFAYLVDFLVAVYSAAAPAELGHDVRGQGHDECGKQMQRIATNG